MGRRGHLLAVALVVAPFGATALVESGSAGAQTLAQGGALGLHAGSQSFTVAWKDGNKVATFTGHSGRVSFSGTAGPAPSFATTFLFLATGRFDGKAFKVTLKLTPSKPAAGTLPGTTFAIAGKIGKLPITGSASTVVNTKTYAATMTFTGSVGSTTISGVIPLKPGRGNKNSATGKITVS